MDLYKEILERSTNINKEFMNKSNYDLLSFSMSLSVPDNSPRYKDIKEYYFLVDSFDKYSFSEKTVYIVDKGLMGIDFVLEFLKDKNHFILEPSESKTKNLEFVNKFIEESLNNEEEVVGIGGGLILNVAGYVAESLQADLVYIPTSIIAMADGSIGGKVRINSVKDGVFIKHKYKSSYEPNNIIIDPRFLETFPKRLLNINLIEIIKYGMYQSEDLLNYIDSNNFYIGNTSDLLRAVLWSATLKKICNDVDPSGSEEGARKIENAGHKISKTMEVKSGLTMSHGESVTIGLYQQTKDENHPLFHVLDKIYRKFGLIRYIE